jgi:TonB-dependent receptor
MKAIKYSKVFLSIAAMTAALATSASAQESNEIEATMLDEVTVIGTRRTIQNSINIKRNSVAIVDALSADDIGDIPALSIGEALETVTGASAHRENGGATEVSIRGLGPFLTNTVINGREATNGGGNRAVNFSIFPSELFNKIGIYKTQSASFVEGAVGGQIALETKRPLEQDGQSIQLNLKGSYNPDQQDIADGDDIGYRGTVSFVDQFETKNGGRIGISLGVQKSDTTNPEQEYTTGTGGGRLEACRLDSFASNAQPVHLDSGRCDDTSGSIATDGGDGGDVSNFSIQDLIDDVDGYNSVDDIPFAYLARDRRYRRNTTGDDRESFFGALQWQPNDRTNINFDMQLSTRDQSELRQDVQFGQTQETVTNLISNPVTGVASSFSTETDIRANTGLFSRDEDYQGFGLNLEYQVNDALEVSFDASYSNTERVETDIEINLGATTDGLIGNRDNFDVDFDLANPSTNGVALATIQTDFDINNPALFTGRDRAQLRARQVIRENTISALRGDFSLDTEMGFVNNLEGGLRYSSLEYKTFGGNRNRNGINEFDDQDFDLDSSNSATDESDAIVYQAATTCGQDSFPESGFLSNPTGGADLFTNAVSGTGTGSTFATFDHTCLANTLLQNYGGLAGINYENGIETNSNDVTEDTLSVYLQANYESRLADKPIRGNFGVRVVNTDITSVGFRSALTVQQEEDGTFSLSAASSDQALERATQKSDYTEVLPSVTMVMDLNDSLIFRGGAFKGLSRPDPNAYGNGRSINVSSGDTESFDTLEDAVSGITATGNPQLKPLVSWNVDAALEWYPNQDTVLAGGIYYKSFEGGFESVFQRETFNIDGNSVDGFVRTTQTSNDSSDLYGLELTASHSFNYLPGFWGGFGAKLSYNYADSNFEFEDGVGGDGVQFDADGNATPLIGILEPAGLFGLSDNVASAQLYWQNDRFDTQIIYKTRSNYFQQFTRGTQARVRYTDDNNVLELRMSYKLNDKVKLSFEGLNLLDEVRTDFRGVQGNVTQVLSYGPRFFFGIQAKL